MAVAAGARGGSRLRAPSAEQLRETSGRELRQRLASRHDAHPAAVQAQSVPLQRRRSRAGPIAWRAARAHERSHARLESRSALRDVASPRAQGFALRHECSKRSVRGTCQRVQFAQRAFLHILTQLRQSA